MGRTPFNSCFPYRLFVPLALLALTSCSQNHPSADHPSGAAAGSIQGSSAQKPSDSPIPPKDAQWTIYCQAVGGVDHVDRAAAAKTALVKMTGMKDWYVIHQEDESVIYYGFYRSMDDPKDPTETSRAKQDLHHLQNIVDGQGNKLLRQCLFVPLEAPDPAAPPEWDLANATGYWSLQIGAFKDSPLRKEAAVEAVRKARNMGIPAYYYHGDTTSSVCVGTWPEAAVQRQSVAQYNDQPDEELLVLPHPLPRSEHLDVRSRATGQKVQAVAPELEVIDPSLTAMMARFPTHAVNGNVMVRQVPDPATGQIQDVPTPSFLVVIPHKTDSFLNHAAPAQLASPALINPGGSSPGGAGGAGGRLRSIGD
jgi:hypothetical protein